jgi:alanine racemase
MTHYRSADELSSEFFWQQKQFEHVKHRVRESGFTDVRVHSHNTAAILRTKNFDEDLVRVGIGAYGYNELPDSFDKSVLRPVMFLYAKKISTRELRAGERLGYGGDYTAAQDMMISTYDLGYGDGWYRGDSTQPYVTSEGLSVLGRVSMDSISLESEKEEVCVMNDAQMAAKQFGTISYEITTALSAELPKEVI